MRKFPLFISLEGKKIYIAGAGNVALRRIRTLLEFGADITVCAPKALPEILSLAETKTITYLQEEYQRDQLDGSFFVLAATDSEAVNTSICEACKTAGIPVNRADVPKDCDFYFPAIALGDGIVVGITGDGTDHGNVRDTAAEIRSMLQKL